MLFKLIVLTLTTTAFAVPNQVLRNYEEAEACKPALCELPNCLCASTTPPAGLAPSQIPQFVVLTFDDAVNVGNMPYYREAFYNRKNPNSCPISTTYFVTHEYTDYSLVHELWANGHEIALHSITHQVPADYWASLSVDGQKREFVDQIDLMAKFAKISPTSMKGIRLPFLQLSGNNSFQMIYESDLHYDSSWPTRSYIQSGLFPYTLDYKSPQDCAVPPCPTVSLPGVWVMPMVDWLDNSNVPCAMIDSCVDIPTDEDGLLLFMKKNFHRHYNGSRSPFGFYIHAAWFKTNENIYKAYKKFLDYLKENDDVFLVSQQQVLEWMKNPKSLNDYNRLGCPQKHSNSCTQPKSCRLQYGAQERYMTTCSDSCPPVYPWLGNPLGA